MNYIKSHGRYTTLKRRGHCHSSQSSVVSCRRVGQTQTWNDYAHPRAVAITEGASCKRRMPRQSLFIHCGNHVGTRCYTHITPLPEHDTCIPALFFRLSDTHLKIRSAHIPLHHRLIKIELLQHEKKNVPVGSRVGTQWLANDNLIQGHAGVGIDFKYRS